MKKPFYLLPVIFFFLLSCDKEDPVPSVENNFIANISFLESSSVKEAQEIEVTVHKGTPCHFISKTVKTISGNTFNYNFILEGNENPCITMVAEEVVTVIFDPSTSGQHTLKFFINGHLFETKTVSVTEESINKEIEGPWTVISFEDYQTSTSITKTEVNTWSDYNNGDITLNFSFTENLSGKISGKNVTNTFYGDFRIDSDRKLIINDILWTEQDEPEWGKMFHTISLAESYELNRNRLIIYYNNRENGIVLERSK